MPESKTQVVSDLVQQLKEGKISKAQLFRQLSSLPGKNKEESNLISTNSSAKLVLHDDRDSKTMKKVHSTNSMNNKKHAPELTQQTSSIDRKEIIQRLINAKKQRQQSFNEITQEDNSLLEHSSPISVHNFVNGVNLKDPIDSPPPVPVDYMKSDFIREEETVDSPRSYFNNGFGDIDSIMSNQDLYPTNSMEPTQNNKDMMNDTPCALRDVDRSSNEEYMTLMMPECTFKPNTIPLPSHYGTPKDASVPFYDRVCRWKYRQEASKDQRKQENLKSELTECTFSPTINSKSKKAATKSRVQYQGIPASERLYMDADVHKKKREHLKKIKETTEEEIVKECTFKPKTLHSQKKNPNSPQPRSRYLEPRSPKKVSDDNDLKDCTFTPKVNNLKSNMESAQVYVQTDIFERLSRLNLSSSISDNAYSENESEFATMLKVNDNLSDCEELERPMSNHDMDTKEIEENRRKFQNFMARQNYKENEKQKKLENVKKSLKLEYKPSINKTSSRIMKSCQRGSFMQVHLNQIVNKLVTDLCKLQRLAKQAVKKEHATVRKKAVISQDRECTFKPKINTSSARRKSRSCTELSRGDLLRKETYKRLLKLKKEQEEMSGMSFKPKLNPNSLKYEGRLKVTTDPDTYIQRVQSHAQMFSEKQRKAIQEQEKEEFAECSFKPQTIEVPAYISRIAKSMALIRGFESKDVKKAEKVEWRA